MRFTFFFSLLYGLKGFILAFSFFTLTACMSPVEEPSATLSSLVRGEPALIGSKEIPFCLTSKDYYPYVVISGFAKYEAREIYREENEGSSGGGLGHPSDPRPIRYAEVRVINSRTEEVEQCAETDAFGRFQFKLPKSSDVFYIFINSRVNNKIAKASVMDSPLEKGFYSLVAKTGALQSRHLGTYIATAKGKILGGAFHILDMIIKGNQFIQEKIKGKINEDSTILPVSFLEHLREEKEHCLHRETIPKVEVYWQPGVSTERYLESSQNCTSFYLINSQGRLFLCGGKDGDVHHVDTDHFDPSIILHEYSHHVNNFCSKIDAPGVGAHYGNAVIDPRLALEEGWANFFQSAVLNQPYYTDTEGTIDGKTGFLVDVPLHKLSSHCDDHPDFAGCDVPENPGEGNFREFSISRFMWSIFSNPSQFQNGFFQIWSLMMSDFEYLSEDYAFRSMGLIHSLRDKIFQNSDSWIRLRETRNHRGDRKEFGLRLVQSEDPCREPFSFDSSKISQVSDHFLLNNDFYHIKVNNDSEIVLQMNYTSSSDYKLDLDLYLYKEFSRIGIRESLVGFSERLPNRDFKTNESELIRIPFLKRGHYLLNVRASENRDFDRDSRKMTQYELWLNGKYLCPMEEEMIL